MTWPCSDKTLFIKTGAHGSPIPNLKALEIKKKQAGSREVTPERQENHWVSFFSRLLA